MESGGKSANVMMGKYGHILWRNVWHVGSVIVMLGNIMIE